MKKHCRTADNSSFSPEKHSLSRKGSYSNMRVQMFRAWTRVQRGACMEELHDRTTRDKIHVFSCSRPRAIPA